MKELYPPYSSTLRATIRVIKYTKLYLCCLWHLQGRRTAYRVLGGDLIERDHISAKEISFYFRNFHFGMGTQSTSTTWCNFLKN